MVAIMVDIYPPCPLSMDVGYLARRWLNGGGYHSDYRGDFVVAIYFCQVFRQKTSKISLVVAKWRLLEVYANSHHPATIATIATTKGTIKRL